MTDYLVVANAPTTTLTTIAFVSISFLILMLLIKKFAWGPITKVLDERATKIAADIDGAEAAKSTAEQLQQEKHDELTSAKAEAAALVKKARETAEHTADNIILDAKREALSYRERAEKELAVEREQIIDSARREVADLSVQIATKILKKELDVETHEALINSYIEGLGSQNEE